MEMKKQPLTSASHCDFTLEALRQIAPSAFTEVRGADGQLAHKVDFDALRQLLGDNIADTGEECFGFQWVGKQDAKRAAAEPTRQTLRPVVKDSLDWDTTQNLYIEGDNLEVLKLLQRAYLGKVKMIYIDPPYNTGNDFVYEDNFAMSSEEMDEAMGNLDEEGNRLRRNLDSNPRYHSDWCSMIYSRLLVARTLLADDGVIFISIDDNEVHHLRNICDEVFGARNFVAELVWKKKNVVQNDARFFSTDHEYLLVYCRTVDTLNLNRLPRTLEQESRYTNPDNDPRGKWTSVALQAKSGNTTYKIIFPNGVTWEPTPGTYPRLSKDSLMKAYEEGRLWFGHNGTNKPRLKKYLSEVQAGTISNTIWFNENVGSTQLAKESLKELLKSNVFDTPKPIGYVDRMLRLTTSPDSLILDFFSGSATTAHAVMQLNAEDGGKRKYICVQIPEETPEGSEARKAGYNTICDIGKERIRRAGKAVLNGFEKEKEAVLLKYAKSSVEDNADKGPTFWEYLEDKDKRQEVKQELEAIENRKNALDTGFRVLRVDSSNMEDIYFEPAKLKQDDLFSQLDSVKPDRSELDLLFGCMVDWGVQLSHPLRQEVVGGKRLHIVNEGALVACFDKEINLEAISRIAQMAPLRVIFREECFATDADKLNIYEKFKQFCGWNNEEVYKRIHVL